MLLIQLKLTSVIAASNSRWWCYPTPSEGISVHLPEWMFDRKRI